ncbi:MAG: AAA family ATPase [Chitinivibrionales bacterium]|nr:AAA family ATPase [Chitinivibrionales bacterium]
MLYQPWVTAADWENRDPALRHLQAQPAVLEHTLALSRSIDVRPPGIVIVRGPRQVGKSTFLSQFCQKCLAEGVAPRHLALLDAENYDTRQELQFDMNEFLKPDETFRVLCIDEVTSVPNWWKAIKVLADRGLFDNALAVLTGSSADDLDAGADRLPGRRGRRYPLDYFLAPVPYRLLRGVVSLDDYFLTGGMPWAINELLREGQIPPHVYELYAGWIQGAFTRNNHSIGVLDTLLTYLTARVGTPVSVTSLSRDCGLGSNHTGETYLQVLERNYALLTSRWAEPGSRTTAPRKNRKFYPADPFLYHLFANAGRGWHGAFLRSRDSIADTAVTAKIAECIVAAACRTIPGMTPLRYFLGQREIDFCGDECIEVKYQNLVRPAEFQWLEKVLPRTMSLTVVTRNDSGGSGRIRLVPLDKWLCEETAR